MTVQATLSTAATALGTICLRIIPKPILVLL
jgi:hypothetical protein